MQMAWREIHHNFFIDNYSPQEDVDNDDGSAYFKTHDNFLVYGGNGMKNDFGGHDNHHYNNVYAYVGQGLGVCSQQPGHEDYYFNNTAVITGSNVGGFACDGSAKTCGRCDQTWRRRPRRRSAPPSSSPRPSVLSAPPKEAAAEASAHVP